MPTYRVEEASTGRAGCKNKECQDKKEKILKGELRLGSWVDTERFQSWSWKHWGCVTPRQVSTLQEIVGEDKNFSDLDGFDEISAENQDKIREAVEHGHVADSDWKGDVEVNRPGKSGFRVRASKKKEDAEDAPQNDTTKTTKRSRGKKKKEETESEDENEAETDLKPVSKKRKTSLSKRKAIDSKPEPEPEPEREGEDEGEGEGEGEEAPDSGNEAKKETKPRRKSTSKKRNTDEDKEPKAAKPKRSRIAAEKAEPRTTRVTRSSRKSG
ncbi:hypothetical protein LOZ12_004524 [Ophidiomyces ophidiicola]|uniref:Uncharacterized protein n=1 Tax=Ophidiomyces ophidiicola TaxID=1387563 RepID=A0ACB8V5X5_9EURO|nr:hypothetical protein LOZ64_004806 [Ophidiomyces ophidiicola]KAI1954718.1 hypothetical protein LOZ62_000733 [Ophidiomyces ophidiicola]KAI1973438.1 hypothetical protein LOZ56_001876 [Ophidiomyces ophidiicola]KAI2007618.1 hypothetical protein LOZ50_002494 [Ophidiomyces ophidiicola]KAI2019594.1 hypothetical protein LOZ46_003235 [Ophidiomyces ophidiicola]